MMYVAASARIFAINIGCQKSRGIILVELTELFPETSITFLIWILNINFVIERGLGRCEYIMLLLYYFTVSAK